MVRTKAAKATALKGAQPRIQDITVTDAPENSVPIDGGFYMPPVFRVQAVLPHEPGGRVVVGIIVLLVDGRALTSSVRVDKETGVGSVTMRTIPIRDIVTEGIWKVMRRPVLREVNVLDLVEVSQDDAEAAAAIRKLVRYMEARKR